MSSASYPQSIPTPPFSPHGHGATPPETTDNPLKSTINLLDSLVEFYQQERMWVYRTRAALQDAFRDIQPAGSGDDTSKSELLLSPALSPSGASITTTQERSASAPPSPPAQTSSRWLRRKKDFKLRLDGLRDGRTAALKPLSQKPLNNKGPAQREQILDMFEKMMEARMESCERVNRLVRNANRADLHNR